MDNGGQPMDRTGDEVQRLARELLPSAMTIAARITERVLEVVPELAPVNAPDAVRLVRESTDQNIGAMLSTLAFGVTATTIEPPAGTRELMRNLTGSGGDVTHLLRAYRVGHQLLWRLWSEHVYAQIADASALPSVLRISSAHLFDFIDRVCQRVVEHSPAPGARAGAGPLSPATGDRSGTVRALLGADPVDLRAAEVTLGYRLGRHHVALVVAPVDGPADVRRELDPLIAAAGVRALAIPSGEGTWWAWLGYPEPPTPAELSRIGTVPPDAVLVGVGEPGPGRDGFRRSLAQAREAERTARLSRPPVPAVVRHRDIEIAALLCADPDRARELAAERLGGLAARDATGQRLRATVRALLAHGHNRGRAASALNVHHKTVSYRIGQAEELLGRSLSENTYDLHTALLIDLTLHGP